MAGKTAGPVRVRYQVDTWLDIADRPIDGQGLLMLAITRAREHQGAPGRASICPDLVGKALDTVLKAVLQVKNDAQLARLWTSRWICTGSDVQKRPICRQAVFSPTSVQAGYNPCPASSRRCKPLILWRKIFLSTTTSSFTITTSFIYTFTTVNSKKREQRGQVQQNGVQPLA